MPAETVRAGYTAELGQLRLQVELMAVRVDQNLERMREVVTTGDANAAHRALDADDDIDAMTVSLTSRCYDILAREQPVATDLRFIVSVLRALAEFERIGDLALRVVNLWPQHDLLTAHRPSYDVVASMADEAVARYRTALEAWAAQDEVLATQAARPSHVVPVLYERLVDELERLDRPGAVRIAIPTLVAGRSLDRITDHAGIIGTRLLYLLTGDADHLADEVR